MSEFAAIARSKKTNLLFISDCLAIIARRNGGVPPEIDKRYG